MSSNKPLPIDIIIEVARILTDNQDLGTLCNCALICTSVVESIQKFIFSAIDLRSGPYIHERCTLLSRALTSSPHLASFIKVLRITDIAGGYSEGSDVPPWTPQNPDLSKILSSIEQLEKFELSVPLQPLSWDDFSDDVCGALLWLLIRPGLKYISITGVKDLPAALISRCPGLRHLCLRNGTIFITTLPGYFATLGLSDHTKSIVNLDQLRQSSPTKVESLELVDIGNVEFLLDRPDRAPDFTFSRLFADDEAKAEFLLDRASLFPDFSQLRKVSIRQSSYPEVTNTWKIVRKASNTLSSLSWEFVHARSPLVEKVYLYDIPYLRNLDFRISLSAMDVYIPFRGFIPSHPLTPIVQLLESVMRDPESDSEDVETTPTPIIPCQVDTISITLDCTIFDDIPPKVRALFAEDDAWSSLNRVLLSEEHFPALKNILVHIVVRRVSGIEGEKVNQTITSTLHDEFPNFIRNTLVILPQRHVKLEVTSELAD